MLLAAIACCALLLGVVQRRERVLPSAGRARTALVERPLDDLERVLIERGASRIELRRAGGQWEMHAPFPARVSQGAVKRMLDGFERARVSDALSFQDLRRRELSLGEFGLAPAAAQVTLAGAERGEERFQFGSLAPLGREAYVRVNDLAQIFVVPSDLLQSVPLTADDLRSRKLSHCDRSQLRGIELRASGRPFIKLSKETGTWRLVQPASAPASDEKVEWLLDGLDAARVTRFIWPTVSNVMDVAEADAAIASRMELYGFGADALQVVLQESGSGAASRVVFGRALDDMEALNYVLLPGGEAVGAVSNQVVKQFQLRPSDLYDTRLFFEKPDSVRRLEVYFGDLLYVLTQTNSVWKLQAPVSDVADQHVVKDTVEQLLRLKADAVLDEAAEARRGNGEAGPPVSHVVLASDLGAVRFSIAPDDFAGNRYRVVFTNSPSAFLVASSNMPAALVSMVGLLGMRDKTVLALPEESLRRITVKRSLPPGADVLQRESGTAVWRIGEGQTGTVEQGRLSRWLGLVGLLKADRIEKLGLSLEDLDSYGLRSPWLEVSLDVDATDAVRKTLLVGKEAGFGKRYAMVRGLDVLFVLDGESLSVLASRLIEPL
jgi:hypothetical protein